MKNGSSDVDGDSPTTAESSAGEATSTPRRIAGLDGLRGIAVLLVVGLHTGQLQPGGAFTFLNDGGILRGGFLGVDIFFVLSGFLITDLLLREHRATGRLSLARFWQSRAFRLIPALVILLSAYVAWSALVGYPHGGSPDVALRNVVASLTFTLNWLPWSDPAAVAPEIGHLWSLAVEEQFYLVWPVIVVVVLRFRRSTRFMVVGLIAAIIAVSIRRAIVFGHSGWLVAYVRTDTRIDGLLIGALLAFLSIRPWHLSMRLGRAIGVVSALGLLLAVTFVYSANRPLLYDGGFTAVALAAAGVIIAIVHGPWANARALSLSPLRAIGRTSYALYLWHLPIFFAVAHGGSGWHGWERLAVAYVATGLAVRASWFLIERPSQAMRRRVFRHPQRQRRVRLADLGVGAAVGVSAGVIAVLTAVARGDLRPSSNRGDALPDFFSIRAMAFFHLQNRPPTGLLMADSLRVGGSGVYDLSKIMPVLVRLPVAALSSHLHANLVAVSIVVGFAVFVIASTRLALRLADLQPDKTASPSTCRCLGVGLGVLVVAGGTIALGTSSAQALEVEAWGAAFALVWLSSISAVLSRWHPARLAVFVIATVLLVLSIGPMAWIAAAAAAAVSVVLAVTRRSVRPTVVAGCSLVVPLLLIGLVNAPASSVASVGHSSMGWRPYGTGAGSDLFVTGDCADLSSGTGSAPGWRSVSTPVLADTLTFATVPNKNGRLALVALAGESPATVTLESESSGRVRFVFDHGSSRVTTEWNVILSGATHTVVVASQASGLEYSVEVDGVELGSVPSVDSTGGSHLIVPAVLLDDAKAQTGATIDLSQPNPSFPELCRAVRDKALSSPEIGAILPPTSRPDDLIILGDCASLYSGTGTADRPWVAVEARPIELDVTFPTGAPGRGSWQLVHAGEQTALGVVLESDGTGRVRYRVGASVVQAVTAWYHVGMITSMDLRVDFDGPTDDYSVSVDHTIVGRLPSTIAADDGAPLRRFTNLNFVVDPTVSGSNIASTRVVQTARTPLCDFAQSRWAKVVQEVRDLNNAKPGLGALASADSCRSIYSSTSDATQPWVPVEIAPVVMDVSFSAPDTGLSSTHELLRISDDPLMRVVAETDTSGHHRYRVVVPFLSSDSPWTRTEPTKSEHVTVVLTPDGQSYNVLLGSQVIGTLPALITSSTGQITRLLPRIPDESPYVVDVSWPATNSLGVSTRELIRLSDDPLMRVVVETDNAGRHRYRIVVPYLSSDTPWSDSTEAQTLTAEKARDGQTYVIKLDGIKIGSLPAVLARDDGSVRQLSPTIVSKSDGVSASLEAVADSTLCRRLVAQSTGS